MPILTPQSVHLDQPLSNLTLAYVQSQEVFVADKIFPVVGVQKQSDKYYIYDRGNANRKGDVQKLAPRTEVNRIGQSLSNDAYFADVYGLGMDFDAQTLANEDEMLATRAAGAETLINRMMIHREGQFADTFFANNVWGTSVTGATNASGNQPVLWSDYTHSTPIANVTLASTAMQLKSGGFKPNTMVIGKAVRDILVNHPDILARLNGGSTINNPALIINAKLAEIFGMENIYVMEAVENTAAEGAAEAPAFIGGDNALLCYTPKAAGLRVPASGLTFAWNNIEGANNLGVTVESFSDDALARVGVAEQIQVKMSYDMKLVGPDLGYFFNQIIA
jgi:hypothetical protein